VALDAAGARADGATLYVTLEPCCHTGRTGPCTRRILASRITRVVVATLDPFPLVAGQGVRELRDAGVAVEVGVDEGLARRLNAGYLRVHEHGLPLIILKAAVSRDGMIAARPGERTLISSPQALRRTQRLRAATDAIAVGIGTVLADDPILTVRDTVRARPYVRVVFDRQLRTPPMAALFTTLDAGPVLIVTAPGAPAQHAVRAAALRARGADLIEARTLADACGALATRDVHTVLVEGGGSVHRAFLEARLADRVYLCVASRALGPAGVPLFGGHEVPWAHLRVVRAEPCGPDVWMEADVHWDR